MIKYILTITVCALTVLPAISSAELYKWVDEEGNTHYGDHIPPQYAPKGHQRISDQGTTLEVVPRAKTDKEIAAEKAAAEKAKAEAEARAKIEAAKRAKIEAKLADDSRIINSYTSAKSIEKMRNEKVALIEASVRLAVARNEKFDEELAKLQLNAAKQERSGKAVDENTLKRIAEIQQQIDENNEFISTRRKEQSEINATFEKEIKRYIELTTKK